MHLASIDAEGVKQLSSGLSIKPQGRDGNVNTDGSNQERDRDEDGSNGKRLIKYLERDPPNVGLQTDFERRIGAV
jgi:hypothetical protein